MFGDFSKPDSARLEDVIETSVPQNAFPVKVKYTAQAAPDDTAFLGAHNIRHGSVEDGSYLIGGGPVTTEELSHNGVLTVRYPSGSECRNGHG